MSQYNQLSPAPDIGDFPYGQETLLFKESTQDFCRLNETASIIWALVKKGHDASTIATQLVRDYAVSPAIAEDFTNSLLRELVSGRFLNDDVLPSTADKTVDAEHVLFEAGSEKPPAFSRRVCFNARNVFFEVYSDSQRCINLLESTFEFLKSRRRPDKNELLVQICIESEANEGFTVRYGGNVIEDCAFDELAPIVHGVFIVRFYEANFTSLAFHCAAMCSEAGTILMPGASGSGKSTLAAALAASGFPYVTDELVLVDLEQGSMLGAPLAIGLKEGSWELSDGYYPHIGQLESFLRQDGQRIKYITPASVCEGYTFDNISCIVFPKLIDEHSLSLHPVSTLETFARLTEAGYDTRRKLCIQDVGIILDWIGSIQVYELRYRDLGSAVGEIVALTTV